MQTNALLTAVLHDLHDLKALHVDSLDVHLITTITDYMVIATGTSSRHVCAIADNLIRKMKARHFPPLSVQGDQNAEWVIVDLGDIVVHIMQPSAREFYHLEKLWWNLHSHRVAIA